MMLGVMAPAGASAKVTQASPYFWGVPCSASADNKRLACQSLSGDWLWMGKTYCYNTTTHLEAIYIQAAANRSARHNRWKIYKGMPQWHTIVKPIGMVNYPYGICDSWRNTRS
jgi:hypothetical protein